VLLFTLLAFEVISMLTKDDIDASNLIQIGALVPVLIACRVYQQVLLSFIQEEH
jgi:hypothetical protein